MTRPTGDAEAERHRNKMAKRKAVQDAEIASKTAEKGLLIVHTGTGKGKSTAAFGLALRVLGRGGRVGVVQFIKGAWHTAERDALAKFEAQVAWHTMGEGFTWETQDRARDVAAAQRAWTKARELLQRVPTVSFTHARHKPTALATSLAEHGINVWSGSNYAIEVLRHLGLDENEGMLRVGLAHYNTQAEVDRIIASLNKLLV